jgi:hypothetical protein
LEYLAYSAGYVFNYETWAAIDQNDQNIDLLPFTNQGSDDIRKTKISIGETGNGDYWIT